MNRRNEANTQEEISRSFKCQKMGHMRGAPGREADDWCLKEAGMETDSGLREGAGGGARAPQHIWTKDIHQIQCKEVA